MNVFLANIASFSGIMLSDILSYGFSNSNKYSRESNPSGLAGGLKELGENTGSGFYPTLTLNFPIRTIVLLLYVNRRA